MQEKPSIVDLAMLKALRAFPVNDESRTYGIVGFRLPAGACHFNRSGSTAKALVIVLLFSFGGNNISSIFVNVTPFDTNGCDFGRFVLRL